jgi:hypothetical protein
MADQKTKRHAGDVKGFLNAVQDPRRRADAFAVLDVMQAVTNEEPAMWGPSIVGFGSYHYVYESGREGDSCLVGFSPRKEALVLYLMGDYEDRAELIAKLGKCKTGKGCVYVKSMEEIHVPTLRRMIRESVRYLKKLYP